MYKWKNIPGLQGLHLVHGGLVLLQFLGHPVQEEIKLNNYIMSILNVTVIVLNVSSL